jgi:hypothetical protein
MLKPKTVKAVDAQTFSKYAEKVYTNFPRKLMATVFWDRRSADGGIHATRDKNIVRSVLRNTEKDA